MAVASNSTQSDLPSIIMQGGHTATTAYMDLLTAGTGTVYTMSINNSANSDPTHFKLWDARAVTVGTTEPAFVFRCTASKIHTISSKTGMTFSTGLSVGITDETGGGKTAGSATGSNVQWVVFGS